MVNDVKLKPTGRYLFEGVTMAHQQRGEDTRAHLLAAAADCFTRAGYDVTGCG